VFAEEKFEYAKIPITARRIIPAMTIKIFCVDLSIFAIISIRTGDL